MPKRNIEKELISSLKQAVEISRAEAIYVGADVVIEEKNYTIVQFSDVIDAPSKKGTKYWQGFVVMEAVDDGRFGTCTLSWSTTKTGLSKQKWSVPFIAVPTNVGRANERNNEAQAFFDFESMVKKEMDKRQSDNPLPMTAQKYQERKKHIVFPCAVQPKYDGMRCLYDGVEPWSRGGKPIADKVFDHLRFDTKGLIIDGELILPSNVKVNKTMEAAKKFRSGISDKLLYRAYDIVDETKTFKERFAILTQIVREAGNGNVIISATLNAYSEADILEHHGNFTDKDGYEGTMVRNWDGLYLINKRSNDLQKYKDFFDAEYKIIDIIPSGGGIAETVGKFICIDEKTGETFESTATGDFEERQDFLTNKHKYIGKYAKVKYREMSGKNGVPFHSNVLEIRDTKDGGH
jgi:ATP-dependent DNA ligase